jgi:hypothetical protein
MTDYHPLIARAVDGLAKNTGEARRALYERARSALVAQLRSVEPALSESDITKERLALEEAIRKVESEAARKALAEPRPQPRAEPRFEPRPAPRQPIAETRPRTPPDPAMEPRRERTNATAADLPPAGQAGAPPPMPPQPPGDEPMREAAQAEAPAAPAKPSARSRILGARTTSLSNDGVRGFRSVVKEADGLGAATAKAAQTARDTRDSYVPVSRQRPQPDYPEPPARQERSEPRYNDEALESAEHDEPPLHSLEPSYDEVVEEPPMPAPHSMRHQPSHDFESDEDEYEQPHPPRSYRGLVKVVVLLLIVLGLAGAGWEFRPQLVGLYYSLRLAKPSPSPQTAQTPAPQRKFPGRVPEEQLPGQAPAAGGGTQQGPAVAQRAVLYEADPNDPQGKRFAGSVVWRTETVSPGPGLAPELVVRADIAIPERHMNVTWSLRRNTDKALPASHTIEVMFNLPADFPGGGISNVPGILMKDSEEVRGMPLAGLAVKVTNGFFLIGLNAADDDMQRNLQLLKERAWFDVLIVYNNNSRAILTMEKGPPGDRAFAEAFKAWGQ